MRAAMRAIVAAVLLMASVVAVDAERASAGPPEGFTASLVLGNLGAGDGGLPVAFAYAPDGRIFIARKTGSVDVYDGGVAHLFLDIRSEVNSFQSRGLLGLALDPAFATNRRVYVMFTKELDPAEPDADGPAGGEIISVQADASNPDQADMSTRTTLLTGYPAIATEHTIGALRFDAQGNLLATLGDASDLGVNNGEALAAEDLDDLRGKLIRIDPTTGAGVVGNPYYDAGQPNSVRSRVFARGFRNAYRFSIDPDNGTVYVGDVGWTTWERLNVFPTTFTNADKDRNAGWPCYEGGSNGVALPQPSFEYAPKTQAACQAIYSPDQGGTGPGAAAPLYSYVHKDAGGENGSAITAGPKYVGTSNYPAQYVGQLFIADYARNRFQTVDPATGVATDFGDPGVWGNPVDVQIAPDGNVAYLGIVTGELREIVYTGSNHVPVAVATAGHTRSVKAPFSAHFDGSGSSDADPGDVLTYDWDFADGSPHSALVNPKHQYTTAGSYAVTLTVSDGHPGGTVATSLWIDVANTAPTVTLRSPLPAFRYKIGDTVKLALGAEDAEDGHITGKHLSTQVRLIHLGHFHPILDFTSNHASFEVLDHGSDDTYVEVISTVTDHAGRSTTSTFDILPNKQPVSVTSSPPGAVVSIDGIQATTPYNFMSIVNEHHEIDAPADLSAGGSQQAFNEWTQGSASVSSEFLSFDTPATGTALNADYSPTAKGLSISSTTIVEGKSGARVAMLDVSLSTPAPAPITVDYATTNGIAPGGATAPSDYAARNGTLTFGPGVTSQSVAVSVNGDTKIEGDEHFTVALSNPQGAPVVQGTGTITIVGDDPGVGLRLSVGDAHVLEGDDGTRNATVTVALSAPSRGGVTVDYATADGTAVQPSDYTPVAGTLTFDLGVTSQSVTIPLVGDGEFEPSEAFSFNLANPVGAPISRSTATVHIANDDAGPALSVGNVSSIEGNSGERVIFFTVALSTPSSAPVVADWSVMHQTTNDGDLKRKTGTVTFAPGVLTANIQVSAFADTDVEADETYRVTLSNPVNATITAATATGTILNDDPSAGLSVSVDDVAMYEGNRGDRRIKFTIGLSDSAPGPVTVNFATAPGTASAGSDFVSLTHGTATIASGATTAAITIIVRSDAAIEPDEFFTVTLSNPGGGATLGRATGTATILNDD